MVISISVRDIVNFALQSGSIDSRFVSSSRAVQGTKIHQKLQKQSMEENPNYQKEVYLSLEFKFDEFSISVDGRADGVILEDEIIVEEIKSTSSDLAYIDKDYNEMHYAQLKFYCYILCRQKSLHKIRGKLIYYSIVTNEIKAFEEEYTFDYLEEYIFNIVEKYKKMAEFNLNLIKIRDESIQRLSFPFPSYREGQRKMSVAVYNSIKEERDIFIKASTGIGKTISTIFPSIKAIGVGLINKIFYLTSKTITKSVAENTISMLKENGLRIKAISITAKDKICFMDERRCNPEHCIHARDFFDKLKSNIIEIVRSHDIFTREIIENIAHEYEICPFELSLEIAKWCDIIICDYNYVFDTSAALKYLFEENSDKKVLLVDESHNLVPRSREMYSSELRKSDVLKLKKMMTGKAPKLSGILGKINKEMILFRREAEEELVEQSILSGIPDEFKKLLKMFMNEAEGFILKNQGIEGIDEVTDLYFKINKFLNTLSDIDDCYINYIDISDKDVYIKLFCIDPSTRIKSRMNMAESTILFSATLVPMDYYMSLVGADKDCYRMFLKSPFNKENLSINAVSLSTRYKDRDNTIDDICDYIYNVIIKKSGNYIAFFPSYKYMITAYNKFVEKYEDITTIVQKNDMKESEREKFLSEFYNNKCGMIAFCVIGGIFSEGIDLTGDSLIGAIVVGVGLPQVCFERNIIKNYYDKKGVSGYDYSYTYPGMNKVLQSAGRVIRTETDRGILVLIDDRYFTSKYKNIMPEEWSEISFTDSNKMLLDNIESFWNESNDKK